MGPLMLPAFLQRHVRTISLLPMYYTCVCFIQTQAHTCSSVSTYKFYLSLISVAMIKYPQSTQGERGFNFSFCSKLHYIIAGRSSQELQTANHITSTATSIRAHWLPCIQLEFFTLTQFRTLCLGNGASHGGLRHLTSTNLGQSSAS